MNVITQCLKEIFQKGDVVQNLKGNDVLFVYLFGSYARNNYSEISDIDIAVLFDKKRNNRKRKEFFLSELTEDVEKHLEPEVHFIEINTEKIHFSYQIIKEGIILFNSNNDNRIKFESFIVKRYLDFYPYIQVQNNYALGLTGDK